VAPPAVVPPLAPPTGFEPPELPAVLVVPPVVVVPPTTVVPPLPRGHRWSRPQPKSRRRPRNQPCSVHRRWFASRPQLWSRRWPRNHRHSTCHRWRRPYCRRCWTSRRSGRSHQFLPTQRRAERRSCRRSRCGPRKPGRNSPTFRWFRLIPLSWRPGDWFRCQSHSRHRKSAQQRLEAMRRFEGRARRASSFDDLLGSFRFLGKLTVYIKGKETRQPSRDRRT